MDKVPAQVAALAASAGGVPFAWRETPTGWVIVLEDGRKLTFEKAEAAQPAAAKKVADPANSGRKAKHDTPSVPHKP